MGRSAEKLAALQKLWDLYRSIFAQKGFDVAAEWTEWSEQKIQALDKYNSERFKKLCTDGCKTLPLAILMALIKPLSSIENQWTKITGTPRKREQKIRTIEKAAAVLEDLLGSLPDAPTADNRGTMDTDSLKELRLELIVLDQCHKVCELRRRQYSWPRKSDCDRPFFPCGSWIEAVDRDKYKNN